VNLLWRRQRFAQLKAESSLPLRREGNSYVNIVPVLTSVRSSNKELVKQRAFNKIMWQEISGWHDREKILLRMKELKSPVQARSLSQRVSTDEELRLLKITKVCLFPYHQGHQLPGKSFGQDSMKVLMLRQVSRAPHYPLWRGCQPSFLRWQWSWKGKWQLQNPEENYAVGQELSWIFKIPTRIKCAIQSWSMQLEIR